MGKTILRKGFIRAPILIFRRFRFWLIQLVQWFSTIQITIRKRKSLVLFILPMGDVLNGGVISIGSIYEETKRLLRTKGEKTDVLLVTSINAPRFLKFSGFSHSGLILHLPQLVTRINWSGLDKLLIHVPEYYFEQFITIDYASFSKFFRKAKDLSINILNQNISLMVKPEFVRSVREQFNLELTITAAHQQYANQRIAQEFNVPYHYLSVFIDPSLYSFKRVNEKKNIICFSPDLHKFREETIEYIARHLPEFELITISGLSYRTYKELIADAKYMITFGEGLDGYFIETIFSGGISMAMYNSEFFTPDFRDVPGVFDPMEDFKLLVVRMIRGTLGTTAYEQIQRRQFEVCSKYYRLDLYSQNIRTFYEKKFNVQSRILADTNIKIDRT